MWVNHHRLFSMIRRSDNKLLMLNLLLLLAVTIVPFPTQLLTDYLLTADAVTAARIYCIHGFNLALAYNLLWRHAAGAQGRLLGEHVDSTLVAAISHQYRFGPALYLVCLGLTFWSAYASVVGCAILAIFFAIPPPDVRRKS
jgi:uncharacterized membrane protein